MAQHKTWVCDRCGEGGEGSPTLNLHFYINGKTGDRDLCSNCLILLIDWVDEGWGRA